MQTPYSRLDIALAHFLGQRVHLTDGQQTLFQYVVQEVSYQQSQGHSCITINDEQKACVLASGMAVLAEMATTPLPLVVEGHRLYLHRYWQYENRLAQKILTMVQAAHTVAVPEQTLLNRYFPPNGEIDWQREAAKMAVSQYFSIITGGPGTGKTTTVVKILAILQETNATPLHIALAAPTGKAAMRLQESIGNNKAALPCDEAIRALLPDSVTTLHRLLGAKPPSPYFQHHAANPLPYDLVVVDEASMVDLALMAKLLAALKTDARLILLGDQDQLASVESGAVLNDLTASLEHHTQELKKSHRFAGTIKDLAVAVNQQQAAKAWQCLHTDDTKVALLTGDWLSYVAGQYAAYLTLANQGADFLTVFAAFNRFQVLCANSRGKKSVADVNYQVEQRLIAQGLIHNAAPWYVGKPIMIGQNQAALQLYNGDIGLCLPDRTQGNKLMVFFQDANGQVKKYLPARLPPCDTVFAMTIHKSQGSEFEEVLIMLPDTVNPVLTKELLYTGITRAKHTLKISASQTVFNATVASKVSRMSGLGDKLRHGLGYFT
jgi:exodeoxyribonuclease V alpha subunit